MRTTYRILFLTSEMVPFAKTGGLADVAASLPKAFRERGHDIRVVMPLYPSIAKTGARLEKVFGSMCVHMGGGEEWCTVYRADMDDGLPVFFIEHERFFGRLPIYHDAAMNDYADNPARYAFLCRAALQLCRDEGYSPHIIHCNDWQTAPAAAYAKTWHWDDPQLGRAASVLTIHNHLYQGIYPASWYDYLGLGWEHFNAHAFESYGKINFLKGGIQFADVVTTVSPGYAHETATPFDPGGLAPYLSDKKHNYIGILNGVDYTVWSPDVDPLIPARYGREKMSGKKKCKLVLQRTFGIDENDKAPLIGMVGRMSQQKGHALIAGCLESVVRDMDVRFVLLGSGDPTLESFFRELAARYPGRIGCRIGYDEPLAHLIEAGSDFFCMPSLYEPCGLTQLYALRYGTLPVVRATGGLDDTVEQYDEQTGAGTGFKFYDATPPALFNTIGWVVSTWYDRIPHIRAMRKRAMGRDFSWTKSARRYESAYRQARQNKAAYDAAFKTH